MMSDLAQNQVIESQPIKYTRSIDSSTRTWKAREGVFVPPR